uniref:Predicted protein n=1 Tax=Hordeum vulgare subsp. vulgare TaxID=112509 RepID=F2E0J4_HORVV|nr:predicted protein [Hordeum vulgare subsp. vulgare]
MVSLMQLVCISGLVLVSFVVHSKQQPVSAASSDEEFHLEKRLIDGHSRTSIPLFRGSNLGIFVRKRPHTTTTEHSTNRRKDSRSTSQIDENILAEIFNHYGPRRSDDYTDNPGPMFGR